MVLLRLAGVLNKKMLVSGNMSIEQFKNRIIAEGKHKEAIFVFAKVGEVKKKVCPPGELLRNLH